MAMTTRLAALLALVAAAPVAADELGKTEYMNYCAACHGAEGRGAGEIADLLTVEVPDLTTLAQRNDGDFPMLSVLHTIDGRSGVRGHGGPMPVYGAMFSSHAGDLGPYTAAMTARGKVLSIALYLESIQSSD